MVFDRRETMLLLFGDFFILTASLWTALLIRNLAIPAWSYFSANLLPFLPMLLLSLAVFYIAGLYEKQTRPIRSVMGVRIFGAQAATVAIAAILFFILPLSIAPKTILILYLVVSVTAESIWRFHRMHREMNEQNRVPALLIGSGPAVLELYEEVNQNDRYLIRFVAHLETADQGAAFLMDASPRVKIVIVDTSDTALLKALSVWRSEGRGTVLFRDLASVYEEIFDRVPLDHFDEAQFLNLVGKRHSLYDAMKRVFDIALALLLSLFAIPFIGIAAIVTALGSGIPFFRHERIGKNGRTFRLIKLRSMLLNDHGDPELQKKNRVTALGRFLRKTRIDELPQLWNVLAGDLSFIGPRPELPAIATVYEREIPQYWMRHLITPGLSGWAQIHDYDAPRGPADVVRTRRKLSFDLYYLKHRSFGLDIAIAAKTLRTLLAFSGT